MKIGYLHIGPPEHGVCRYGRLLAAEARKRADLTVIEAEVSLTEDPAQNRELLVKAAQKLSQADVIHFQSSSLSNKDLWGGGSSQLDNLQVFMDNCSSPLAVTLHDLFLKPYNIVGIFQNISSRLQNRETDSNKGVQVGFFGPGALAIKKITNRAKLIFIFNEEQYHLLSQRCERRKLKIVPHFIEERPQTISRDAARRYLGFEQYKIITLQGFIYSGKGHNLVIEAMADLASDIKNLKLIFAGGPPVSGNYEMVDAVIALAKEKKVDNLEITGYLSEEELEMYLMATDLAVCPFSRCSASGSLSTWISLGRTILASDLPQIAEYNKLEPGAIETFNPYTPNALAEAIREILPICSNSDNLSLAKLQKKLSISAIFERHLNDYRLLHH
jgi:glycosyltransferase involved in cell wall biosynthesis